MRKFYFLFLLFLSTISFGQNLDWFYALNQSESVYSGNFNNSNRVYSIAVDSQENVYMAGSYQENLSFDPTNPTQLQLISANGPESNQCYLVKIDKNRNYLWHKTIAIGKNSAASIFSVTIDKDGNLIVAGTAQGNSINLNPGSSASMIYNTDNYLQNAIFLNKYSKNGDFIFGNFYKGGEGFPKVIVDKDSNIFLSGQYSNYFAGYNTDFDLSDQTFYLNGGEGSAFILKNDSNGNFVNAKFLQGGQINKMEFDNKGNLVVFGNGGNLNFNNEKNFTNQSTGSSGGDYLLKLDNKVQPIWFQSIGGHDIYSSLNDSQPFEIDDDNSIIVSTTKPPVPLQFSNRTIDFPQPLMRAVIFKLDENGKYLWHTTVEQTQYYQTTFPISVSISGDQTINWSNSLYGVMEVNALNEKTETIVGGYSYSGGFGDYASLLKLNTDGKLIYNKSKIINHVIGKSDKANDKLYFAGDSPTRDPNPDFLINGSIPYISGIKMGADLQKLDKCYTGTPDGDHVVYFCVNDQKKIKDLFPKTSYSNWYDSPLSTTPLSGETVLESKKYYAITEDSSCPFNPTRLEVNVKIFQNPPKLVVPDFVFCNLQNKTLNDLKINNVGDLEFFDENLNPIYLGTNLVANSKYYVRQRKSYSYYVSCPSDLTEFHVYDTSVPPVASSSQTFCKSENPKVSDLIVTGINRKWYNSNGDILPLTTELQNSTTYYVTQTNGTCESAKAEVNVVLNDPDVPTGNAIQEFCIAQNPTLANIKVNGINIKWYDQNGLLLPENTLLSDGKIYFATQTIDNCESSQKFSVLVNINANSLPANNYSESFCDDNTDDVKSINLDDFKSKMIDLPQNYKFEYFDKNNQPVASNITLNVGVNVFDVKITSTLGCFKVVKLLLTLDPKPKLNLNPNIEFCDGQSAKLDAGSGFASYLWSNGETSQTISVNKEGRYDVTVKNASGCSNQGSIEVKKSILSSIKSITIFNNSATINMSETEDFLYSLDNINFQSSNVFSNLENKSYTVFVKTQSGCIIGVQNFTIFSLSNSFTPNSDGFNDFWVISGLENYPNSEIIISDKMGNTVLKTVINGKFQWDGKYLGRPLPTDNYWYVIKVSDGRILQGYVLLKNRN